MLAAHSYQLQLHPQLQKVKSGSNSQQQQQQQTADDRIAAIPTILENAQEKVAFMIRAPSEMLDLLDAGKACDIEFTNEGTGKIDVEDNISYSFAVQSEDPSVDIVQLGANASLKILAHCKEKIMIKPSQLKEKKTNQPVQHKSLVLPNARTSITKTKPVNPLLAAAISAPTKNIFATKQMISPLVDWGSDAPTSSESGDMLDEDAKRSLRRRFVHFLAIRERNIDELKGSLKCTTEQLTPLLNELATKQATFPKPVYALKPIGFLELEIYLFNNYSEHHRKVVFENAKKAFKGLGLSTESSEWKKIVQRGEKLIVPSISNTASPASTSATSGAAVVPKKPKPVTTSSAGVDPILSKLLQKKNPDSKRKATKADPTVKTPVNTSTPTTTTPSSQKKKRATTASETTATLTESKKKRAKTETKPPVHSPLVPVAPTASIIQFSGDPIVAPPIEHLEQDAIYRQFFNDKFGEYEILEKKMEENASVFRKYEKELTELETQITKHTAENRPEEASQLKAKEKSLRKKLSMEFEQRGGEVFVVRYNTLHGQLNAVRVRIQEFVEKHSGSPNSTQN